VRLNDIGQQLRAYRMESGLRADEIAARLGVSRAALYRYEKGEVIKLDTVQRLAELLKISPLALLGVGVEYYTRLTGYLERIRQIEESADQILHLSGPFHYLMTSDNFDTIYAEALNELVAQAGDDRAALRAQSDQVLNLMAERRRSFQNRRPNIVAIIAAEAIDQYIRRPPSTRFTASPRLRRRMLDASVTELMTIADLMEAEPIGFQFGLLTNEVPITNFTVLRSRERAQIAINPFRSDAHPTQVGCVMITSAEEAIGAHQRVAEVCWRDALKGSAGAQKLRALVKAASDAESATT
jgi:transcriptional regulator with XRE-family HTH domain